jgi:hypothetical protein
MFDRSIRGVVIAGIGVVVLGGAGLFWTAQRRLLSDEELTGAPCTEITHQDALARRLDFPSRSVEERSPSGGILVSTLETARRCAQIGGRKSCGLDGAGFTRVQANGALRYFALEAEQSAFLDIRRQGVRCVLAPRETVLQRFR